MPQTSSRSQTIAEAGFLFVGLSFL